MTQQSVEALTEKETIVTQAFSQIHRDFYDHQYDAVFELLERVDLNLLKGYIEEAAHQEHMRYK
jgi:hypothetical protein